MNKIVLSSDHGGYGLKEEVKKEFETRGFEIVDLGPAQGESCSYSVKGEELAKYIQNHDDTLGLGFCGSGIGISISVNRFKGVRGALITSKEYARLAKQHNNANVLLFGGRFTTKEQAIEWIDAYLNETFEGGRHIERIEKLDK